MLTRIKKLDDCFGQFLVRVVCDCGACRKIEPEALARLVGWKMPLKELALRMRCSRCGKKAAEGWWRLRGPGRAGYRRILTSRSRGSACVSNPLRVCDVTMILAGPVLAETCAPQSKQPSAVLL